MSLFRRKPRLNRQELTMLVMLAREEIERVQEELFVVDPETERHTLGYLADVKSVLIKLKEMY